MNTKNVPAIIMLLGAAVRCIMALVNGEKFSTEYALSVLIALIVFYIIGLVIKAILDKNFPQVEAVVETSEEESEVVGEMENFQEKDTTGNEIG